MNTINKTTSLRVIRRFGPDGVKYVKAKHDKVIPTGKWKIIHVHGVTYDLYLEAHHTRLVLKKRRVGYTKGLWGFFKRPTYEEYHEEVASPSYYIHENLLCIETAYENGCGQTQQ